jgi:hypothetical protein
LSPTLKDRLYAGANSQSPGNALFREAVSRIEALEEHARKLERELALRVDLASENADLRQRKAELERELAAVTQERDEARAEVAALTGGGPCVDGCCLPDGYTKIGAEYAENFARTKRELTEAQRLADRYLREREQAKALGDRLMAVAYNRGKAETAPYAGGLEAFVVAARRVAGYLTAKEPIDYIRDGEAWNARARFLQLLKQAEDARAALAAKPQGAVTPMDEDRAGEAEALGFDRETYEDIMDSGERAMRQGPAEGDA